MTFIYEFASGDVKVVALTEGAALENPAVMAKIQNGEMILNIRRNPRGRADSPFLPCGCNRYIERVRHGVTVKVDRLRDRTVCTGCGRPHKS